MELWRYAIALAVSVAMETRRDQERTLLPLSGWRCCERVPFGMYSYMRICSPLSMQHPRSRTRFGWLTDEISLISFVICIVVKVIIDQSVFDCYWMNFIVKC